MATETVNTGTAVCNRAADPALISAARMTIWRALGGELDEMQEQELQAIRQAHDALRQRLQVMILESSTTDSGSRNETE